MSTRMVARGDLGWLVARGDLGWPVPHRALARSGATHASSRISTGGAVAPFIDAPFSVGGQTLDAHAGDIWLTDFNSR